jgi:hypothetical protein
MPGGRRESYHRAMRRALREGRARLKVRAAEIAAPTALTDVSGPPEGVRPYLSGCWPLAAASSGYSGGALAVAGASRLSPR